MHIITVLLTLFITGETLTREAWFLLNLHTAKCVMLVKGLAMATHHYAEMELGFLHSIAPISFVQASTRPGKGKYYIRHYSTTLPFPEM